MEPLLGTVPGAGFPGEEKSTVSPKKPATGVELEETPWKYLIGLLELLTPNLILPTRALRPPSNTTSIVQSPGWKHRWRKQIVHRICN